MTRTKQKKLLLETILTIQQDACSGELNPLKKYFDEGDYLKCWQTLLGNRGWLISHGYMPIEYDKLETMAQNVALRHHHTYPVTIREEHVVNGRLDGQVLVYDVNNNSGRRFLRNRYYYSNGNIEGEDIYYHNDGITPEIIQIRSNNRIISEVYFDEKGTFLRHSLK